MTTDKRKKSSIMEILQRHSKQLMSIPGIVGVGIGKYKGTLCIKVLVVEKTPELMQKIPPTLENIKVVIEERGIIRPMKKS